MDCTRPSILPARQQLPCTPRRRIGLQIVVQRNAEVIEGVDGDFGDERGGREQLHLDARLGDEILGARHKTGTQQHNREEEAAHGRGYMQQAWVLAEVEEGGVKSVVSSRE